MNTKSVSIQKQKGQSSNADHFNHQLQVLDGENENQEQYHQAKEVSFEPPQQRRLHGKAVADTCSLKYNHNYTGYTRFRERVHDVQYNEEATNVCFKRTKGDKESCIPRSSGSKNRHCKVPTPNGLRDRRVRLSANTAIEFYDVQDRLGFDRSSNAIDWLMKEAEAAINALGKEVSIAQLPCHVEKDIEEHLQNQTQYESQLQSGFLSSDYNINQDDQQLIDDSNFSFISLLCGSNSSTSISFPSYHHGFDPSMKNHNEDLCLSLQTFQDDPTLLQQNLNPYSLVEPDNSISLGSTPINFNLSPNPHWFHKVIDQNSNSKQPLNSQERHSGPFHEQQEMCSQRESLQPTILPSTNNSFTRTDCDWTPLCNTSSTGLVYNEFPISIRGQGETSKPISISSSATKTFLHYQEYQN